MVLKDICNFLKKFSNIVSDEDKNKLINIQSHLEYVNNSKPLKNKYGDHYKDCVWSDEKTTCGPDTCPCISIRTKAKVKELEAKELMKTYINIYNLTKCKNCTFNK